MCDHSGQVINYNVCPDPAGDSLMDCNHDDYYSTNPPANSYLAMHWNTASNQFLISPNSASVNTAATGTLRGKVFTPTSTFTAGQTVTVRVHVVDQWGANLDRASVSFTVKKTDGSVKCTFAATTDSTGTATGSCSLPKNAVKGTWKAQVDKVVKTGYAFDTGAPTILIFTVQ